MTESAYNPVSCVLAFQRAVLPLDLLSQYDGATDARVFESFSPTGKLPSRTGEEVSTLSSQETVWLKTSFEDPIQIDVNDVYVEVTFTYNGACVLDSWGHNAVWGYFSGSGWYLASNSGSAARNCSYAATQATGYFENWAWGNDNQLTWTRHCQTTVYGEENGSQTNQYNLTKGGEDAGLLHTQILSS